MLQKNRICLATCSLHLTIFNTNGTLSALLPVSTSFLFVDKPLLTCLSFPATVGVNSWRELGRVALQIAGQQYANTLFYRSALWQEPFITNTFKSKTELVQLSDYNYVFLRWLLKSICFRTAQEEVGNFKCIFWFCGFCFRRWIETCWSERAQMATKAEIKYATGDRSLRCGTAKLHLVNSPPTRRQWEAFQLFKPNAFPPFMLSLEAAAEVNACFHGYQVQIFPPHSHIWLVAQETRSVYLALCPRLQLLGAFTCITLTGCWTQGGMKPETPRHQFPFPCPKNAKPYDIHYRSARTNTGAVWSSKTYFADSDLKPVNSYHPEHF